MIKVLIIDDEEYAREVIREYLSGQDDIEISGDFSDGFSALKAIVELKPDLIFLDIQMPKLTGFEMLEIIDKPPMIIFTTAFDDYAIKAFEQNAVDYLLKPFSRDRFISAIDKARLRLELKDKVGNIEKLKSHLAQKNEIINRIVVKTRHEIKIIPVDEVVFIEAQDDYVMIYLKDEKYLKQKTMKFFEKSLSQKAFVRVHRSFIVKIDQIKSIEAYEKSSNILILNDGRKIPVSRTGRTTLKYVLDI